MTHAHVESYQRANHAETLDFQLSQNYFEIKTRKKGATTRRASKKTKNLEFGPLVSLIDFPYRPINDLKFIELRRHKLQVEWGSGGQRELGNLAESNLFFISNFWSLQQNGNFQTEASP